MSKRRNKMPWCIFSIKGRKKSLQRCTGSNKRLAQSIRKDGAKKHPKAGRWVVRRATKADVLKFGIGIPPGQLYKRKK